MSHLQLCSVKLQVLYIDRNLMFSVCSHAVVMFTVLGCCFKCESRHDLTSEAIDI